MPLQGAGTTYSPVAALVDLLERDGRAFRIAVRIVVRVRIDVARTHETVKVTADLESTSSATRVTLTAASVSTFPWLTMGSRRSYAMGLRPPMIMWLLAVARGSAESAESAAAEAASFEKAMLSFGFDIQIQERDSGQFQGRTVGHWKRPARTASRATDHQGERRGGMRRKKKRCLEHGTVTARTLYSGRLED